MSPVLLPNTIFQKCIRRTGFHLLALCFLFSITAALAQETIPDGTQGEVLEVVESDTLPAKWRDKRWRLFNGRISTFKLGGGFLYEFAGYIPDKDSKRQMDSLGMSLDPEFDVRDFRFTVSGQFKTKRTISWKGGFMYDGASGDWFVRETGIMINVPELWGNFFIGRTKEGFSLNKVMVGYAGWTMERQMAIDVIPILADGIKWMGYLPKQRIFWNTGAFADWTSKSQSFSTYQWQWVLRTGWLPIYDESKNEVLHAGINYRYGKPVDGEIQLRSRPEVNPAPYFIETGKFPADHSNHWGLELYYRKGPLLIGGEGYMHRFHSPGTGNPVFYGGDVVITYLITGETRPYHTASSVLGFVPVDRPVFKGGPGAWEVVLRISAYDLTDGTLEGGDLWRITPMINWYLTKDIRLELVYGYGVLDRFQLKGGTQFFQSRLQFTLL